MRSSLGSFLFAFAGKLQASSITEAELYAIFTGIRMARERSFSNIMVESDSLNAVWLINSGCPQLHPNFMLICEIQNLLRLDDGSTVSHVVREANKWADCFAKEGLNLVSGSMVYDQLPSFACNAFRTDLAGVSPPRGC